MVGGVGVKRSHQWCPLTSDRWLQVLALDANPLVGRTRSWGLWLQGWGSPELMSGHWWLRPVLDMAAGSGAVLKLVSAHW